MHYKFNAVNAIDLGGLTVPLQSAFHWMAGIGTAKNFHIYLSAERESETEFGSAAERESERAPGCQNAIDDNNEYKNTNNFYVYYFEVIVSIVLVRSCLRYEK